MGYFLQKVVSEIPFNNKPLIRLQFKRIITKFGHILISSCIFIQYCGVTRRYVRTKGSTQPRIQCYRNTLLWQLTPRRRHTVSGEISISLPRFNPMIRELKWWYFSGYIFKRIFLNKDVWISCGILPGHWLSCTTCWQYLLKMKWLIYRLQFLQLSTSPTKVECVNLT